MSNVAQLKLLLNQLYNCAVAFYSATVNDDSQEAEFIIEQKIKLLKLIDENKKFAGDGVAELFKIMSRKLQEQEEKNIQLLKAKKSVLYRQYRDFVKKNQLADRYNSNSDVLGNIVDIAE